MSTMRAARLQTADGIDSVTIEQLPVPEPGSGEVRVRIVTAALNHRELWISKGMYPRMQLPTTIGADASGIVDAVGPTADANLLGREVVIYPGLEWGVDEALPAPSFGLLGMPGPGTLAEYLVVPAENVAEKPPHLSFAEAAALPLAGLTAWRALFTKAKIAPGERLLVTGIGGGVAGFALLFAHAAGARVFVTSGSDEALERARGLGAVAGFDYRAEKWASQLGEASGGIDVVVDGAPSASFPAYCRRLATGARVVIYGSTGGLQFPVSAPELFLRNLAIIGTNVGNRREFDDMLAFVATNRLVPPIDRTFELGESVAALRHLRDHHTFGKVVVATTCDEPENSR